MLWEVLDVLRRLSKGPLQCCKASLLLGRVAWVCCLTISKEWSYSESCCQEQHCCTTRTELRSCFTFWIWCVYSKFYTHLGFAWEVWRVPHKNRSNRNFLFLFFFVSLTIIELPIFKPHTTLTDRPPVPGSAAAFRHVSGVVGYIANKDQRTCDAGWPEQLLSRCLWITECGWRRIAAAKPPR